MFAPLPDEPQLGGGGAHALVESRHLGRAQLGVKQVHLGTVQVIWDGMIIPCKVTQTKELKSNMSVRTHYSEER